MRAAYRQPSFRPQNLFPIPERALADPGRPRELCLGDVDRLPELAYVDSIVEEEHAFGPTRFLRQASRGKKYVFTQLTRSAGML